MLCDWLVVDDSLWTMVDDWLVVDVIVLTKFVT